MTDNPDIAALRAFMETGEPVTVTTNPLLEALETRLVAHDPATRTVTLDFTPPPLFRQGAGALQGGAVAAMLDFAMAFAGFTVLAEGRSASTVALSTQFCAAARNERLSATGTVERAGRQMVFTTGRLTEADRLIATGSATLAVLGSSGAGSSPA